MRKKNKKVSLAKKPFLVLSRRAISGWVAVVFVVCGWMFAMGIVVGRGCAPIEFDVNESQRKLEVSIKNLKQKQQGRPPEESESVKDRNDLDFYEALQDNRDDDKMSENAPAPAIEKKEAPLPEDKPAKPKKESRKKKTISQKKDKAKPESPNNEPAKPSETSTVDKKGDTKSADEPYAIQIAAFKDAADADKKVAELKKKGFQAYRAIGKVPGKGIWYRVRIGEYHDKAEAGDMMSRLRKAGLKPILVER
ncbi:MAG: SPOR domain-containing protein [Desulfobacterales bacterium]|nr:MAG: SPOR domain-containing protein [Desulfobacterales bacterium]